MTIADKLKNIYDLLYREFGECECPLRHSNPFQLMAAVMLSAQCRDERVNQVTQKLFAAAPDAASMAELSVEEISNIIRPCGLFENKGRNLHASAVLVRDKFHGELPQSMAELLELPGIGRKSANVILGNAFGIPGFPVDTHVQRLMKHFKAAQDGDSPEKIEDMTCKRIPPELWSNFSHLLITHGRQVCIARRPQCAECVIKDLCRSAKLSPEKNK